MMALFECFKHTAPQKFSRENLIGWNPQRFSPVNFFAVCCNILVIMLVQYSVLCCSVLVDSSETVCVVEWSMDGKHLMTVTERGTVTLWTRRVCVCMHCIDTCIHTHNTHNTHNTHTHSTHTHNTSTHTHTHYIHII